jgi:hypothetical protein
MGRNEKFHIKFRLLYISVFLINYQLMKNTYMFINPNKFYLDTLIINKQKKLREND